MFGARARINDEKHLSFGEVILLLTLEFAEANLCKLNNHVPQIKYLSFLFTPLRRLGTSVIVARVHFFCVFGYSRDSLWNLEPK